MTLASALRQNVRLAKLWLRLGLLLDFVGSSVAIAICNTLIVVVIAYALGQWMAAKRELGLASQDDAQVVAAPAFSLTPYSALDARVQLFSERLLAGPEGAAFRTDLAALSGALHTVAKTVRPSGMTDPGGALLWTAPCRGPSSSWSGSRVSVDGVDFTVLAGSALDASGLLDTCPADHWPKDSRSSGQVDWAPGHRAMLEDFATICQDEDSLKALGLSCSPSTTKQEPPLARLYVVDSDERLYLQGGPRAPQELPPVLSPTRTCYFKAVVLGTSEAGCEPLEGVHTRGEAPFVGRAYFDLLGSGLVVTISVALRRGGTSQTEAILAADVSIPFDLQREILASALGVSTLDRIATVGTSEPSPIEVARALDAIGAPATLRDEFKPTRHVEALPIGQTGDVVWRLRAGERTMFILATRFRRSRLEGLGMALVTVLPLSVLGTVFGLALISRARGRKLFEQTVGISALRLRHDGTVQQASKRAAKLLGLQVRGSVAICIADIATDASTRDLLAQGIAAAADGALQQGAIFTFYQTPRGPSSSPVDAQYRTTVCLKLGPGRYGIVPALLIEISREQQAFKEHLEFATFHAFDSRRRYLLWLQARIETATAEDRGRLRDFRARYLDPLADVQDRYNALIMGTATPSTDSRDDFDFLGVLEDERLFLKSTKEYFDEVSVNTGLSLAASLRLAPTRKIELETIRTTMNSVLREAEKRMGRLMVHANEALLRFVIRELLINCARRMGTDSRGESFRLKIRDGDTVTDMPSYRGFAVLTITNTISQDREIARQHLIKNFNEEANPVVQRSLHGIQCVRQAGLLDENIRPSVERKNSPNGATLFHARILVKKTQ